MKNRYVDIIQVDAIHVVDKQQLCWPNQLCHIDEQCFIKHPALTNTKSHRTQIQFELYYFYYEICLHTGAIYVLLWNVAIAGERLLPIRNWKYVRCACACAWDAYVCVWVWKIMHTDSMRVPINFTIVDNLLLNYMFSKRGEQMAPAKRVGKVILDLRETVWKRLPSAKVENVLLLSIS